LIFSSALAFPTAAKDNAMATDAIRIFFMGSPPDLKGTTDRRLFVLTKDTENLSNRYFFLKYRCDKYNHEYIGT
jgi:hypothetical protein